MPVTSSAADSTNNGPSNFSRCDLTNVSSRASTASRGAPVRCSSAMTRTRGRNTCSPAMSLPTAAPVQRIVPSEASANCASGASASRMARAPISPASAFCAALCSALASEPPDEASATNMNPSSRPMTWPSTTTSPVLLISRLQRRVFTQPPHQHAGAAIDETLGEPLVQRVGQLVFDGAGDALPMFRDRPANPAGWRRKSRSGCARCASTAYRYRRRCGRPARSAGQNQSVVDFAVALQIAVYGDHEFGMVRRRDLAIVGNLADFP